jgi:outer membrane protein assembly factor BamB
MIQNPIRPPVRRNHVSHRVFVRRRLALVVALLLVVSGVAYGLSHLGGGASPAPRKTATANGKPVAAPLALAVTPAPWTLSAPLSRAVALPAGGRIRVFGGLGPANATESTVVDLDPATGQSVAVGTLADPVHDAAGAVLANGQAVFGGGASKVVTTVQGLPAQSGAAVARLGVLPAPRADLAAVTVGGQAILVGGYDGTNWSPDVLATRDGTTFTVLAHLPQPVRYPAVAAVGGRVYVIGGELPGAQGDAAAIQVIDVAARTATVAATLPAGVSHAGAAVLGSTIYLFGGRSAGHILDTVSALDTTTLTPKTVAALPVATSDMAVATVGGAAYLLGGEDNAGHPLASVAVARLAPAPSTAGRPFDGQLLIADRGNNRLLLVDTAKNVLWRFPSATAPAPPQGFYFPDDAFFAKHGTAIITNEEEQNTIIELAYPAGTVIASYGHAGKAGVTPGYLSQPDDAYLLADGRVTVADAKNCRLVFLNPDFTYQGEIGSGHRCIHNPPRFIAYPNGDTPLANGNFLVSEINGSYVDELRPDGTVVWSLKLPLAYPSDPQQIGPDLYLIADYAKPGGLYEFTREGTIVWSYTFSSGEPMLDHPSLAEQLPNGLISVNDDYRHRVVLIDPMTKTIVWQYGQTDAPGTGPDQLNIPDGFDLKAPDNSTPTHPQTG